MKKTFIVLSMASIAMVSVIGLSSFCKVVPTSEVHANGYGDGHCTKCGMRNGSYNCKMFVPAYNHPSICICGHSKAAHAYK